MCTKNDSNLEAIVLLNENLYTMLVGMYDQESSK